jgi:hypothetical protein
MWSQAINVALGVWLIVGPYLIGYGGPARQVDHLAGPVVIFFAMLALRDVTRVFRLFNLICGLWVLLMVWILHYGGWQVVLTNEVTGLAIMVFAVLGGFVTQRTGGGWLALWPPNVMPREQSPDVPREPYRSPRHAR